MKRVQYGFRRLNLQTALAVAPLRGLWEETAVAAGEVERFPRGSGARAEVVVPIAPEVQLVGDAVQIRGRAALDAYRVLAEGVGTVRRRDGIEPPPGLRVLLAALKSSAAAAARASSDVPDIADVRRQESEASLRSGELIGSAEAAEMCGLGERQLRRLAGKLGGRKSHNRWVFDKGLVEAYLDTDCDRRNHDD